MFERFNQIAEQAATNVSRRQFLGRLGRGAMAAAAATGGLLAFSGGKPARLCSSTGSSFYCTNALVGSPCPGGGRCVVIRGTYDHCYCKTPGKERR